MEGAQSFDMDLGMWRPQLLEYMDLRIIRTQVNAVEIPLKLNGMGESSISWRSWGTRGKWWFIADEK